MSATDWERIERDYRAGVLSIREIARQHEVSEGTIRKRAKEAGWERDLAERVQQQARSRMQRLALATDNPATEREIVTQSAAVMVEVVRTHRSQLAQGRALAGLLFAQLADAATCRDELEAAIEAEDATPARRAAMLKAVALPAHAAVLRDLSTVLARLLPLERIAFSIDSQLPPETPPIEGEARVVTDYAELRRRFIDAKKGT